MPQVGKIILLLSIKTSAHFSTNSTSSIRNIFGELQKILIVRPLDPHAFEQLNFDDPYAQSLLKELTDELTVNAQNYANRANAKLANNEDLTVKVKALQERVGSYLFE